MKIFFVLAPEIDAKFPKYRQGVLEQAKLLGFRTVFFDEGPADARFDWTRDQLTECDFAFFDISTQHPDALVAFGVGAESDAHCFALRDADYPLAQISLLVGEPRTYMGPADFQRKVRKAIEDVQGVSTVNQLQLVEKIKAKVAKLGPIPMRKIAQEIGHRPEEIRWLVYALVRQSELAKENYGQWSTYRLPVADPSG